MILAAVAATLPPPAPVPALPLRHDDVLSMALLLKVMLVTGILLAGAYLLLRFYARHRPDLVAGRGPAPALACRAALRLSSRTRAYLVEAGGARVLIVESATGSQALLMPAPAPAADGEAP